MDTGEKQIRYDSIIREGASIQSPSRQESMIVNLRGLIGSWNLPASRKARLRSTRC